MSGGCQCLFHRIYDDGKLLLPDSAIIIRFKSPADAFFAFLYLYNVVDVKDVRTLIQSANLPNAGKTHKAIWRKIADWVVAEGLTTKETLKLIRNPEFLGKTMLKTPGNIDHLVRVALRKRVIPSYSYAAGMPLAVLENVVDFMGSFVCNFARDSSRFRSERSYADDIRRDLVSMSLVHRTWTHLAQLVLRRRVALRSIRDIHKYMQSPHCGPWVQELAIDIAPPKMIVPKHSYSDDEVDLCPACGEYHGEDDDESDEDEDEDEEVEVEDEENPFAFPDPSSMWPSICMLIGCVPNVRRLSVLMLYRTVDFYIPTIDTRGVSLFIKLLGKMRSLEGLALRTLAFHDFSEELSFAKLCKQLSALPNLRRLSLQGFDNVNTLDGREDEDCRQVEYPVSFEGIAPPQVRTLALSIAVEPLIQSNASLAWMLQSQDVLEDLFLHFIIPPQEGPWRDRVTSRMLALRLDEKHFPALRRLRIQVYDSPHTPHFKGSFAKSLAGFLEKCSALTDLYITYSSTPKLSLPSSIINLRLGMHHDRVAFGSNIEIFKKWDSKVVRLLSMNTLPKLCKLTIVMYCCETIASEPMGRQMLSMAFLQTAKWCRQHRVEIMFEDEMNSTMYFDERMNDFVFA